MAALIRRVLAEDGYAIDVVHSGAEACLLAVVNDYDGIVLDAYLGDRHGFEVLQEIRASGRSTPVLLYTGLGDSEAIVRGLDAGADEYVVKPVANEELRARVRSILRRATGARAPGDTVVGQLRLNRLTRRVTRANVEITFTPLELRLLEHLMLRAGHVVTRSELYDKVWDMHFDPGSNVIDAYVLRLRRKLECAQNSVALVTRRGIGFMLQPVDCLPAVSPMTVQTA